MVANFFQKVVANFRLGDKWEKNRLTWFLTKVAFYTIARNYSQFFTVISLIISLLVALYKTQRAFQLALNALRQNLTLFGQGPSNDLSDTQVR